MADWALAKKVQLRCFYVRGVVVLFASGVKPSPCHRVDFEQRPERILPPMFSLRWRMDGLCAAVETEYEYAEAFFVGALPQSIRVHHADGVDDVPVAQADDNTFSRLIGGHSDPSAAGPAGAADAAAAARLTTLAIGEESPPTRWFPAEQPTTMFSPFEEHTTMMFPREDVPSTHWHPLEEGPTTFALGEEGPPTRPWLEDPMGGGAGGGGNPFGNF